MRAPRFVDEVALAGTRYDDIDSFVQHLVDVYQGEIERSPATSSLGSAIAEEREVSSKAERASEFDRAWLARAVIVVEHAIDQLVLEFAAM